jgi:hypothetical protein
MSGLILVSLSAVFILILVVRLIAQSVNKKKQAPLSIEDYSSARKALDLVFVEIAAIRRVFSDDDLKFVLSSGDRDAQELFLEERKRLGINWLRRTQKRVSQIVNLHLRLASYTDEPRPNFELSLTAKYLGFVISSNCILVLLWLLGPFKAAHTVSYMTESAADFCGVLRTRLDNVNRARLGFPVANLW